MRGVVEEPDEIGDQGYDGGREYVFHGEESEADADIAGDEEDETVKGAAGVEIVAVAAIPEKS